MLVILLPLISFDPKYQADSFMKKILSCVFVAGLLAGCATVPPPTLSKGDAIARARLVYSPGASDKRLELPANNTGTGPHDFYNLSAFLPSGSNATYAINIAAAKKFSCSDAQVVADGLGPLGVEVRQELPARLGIKINYVQAIISREQLYKAATTGAKLQLTSSGGSLGFTVPDWMFAALLETADKNDWHRKFEEQKEQARQQSEARLRQLEVDIQTKEQERQNRRELYVKEHPEVSQRIKDAVLKGSIILGMSSDAARAAWGEPKRVNRTVNARGVSEQWVYGDTYVYFDDNILTSWQDSR
jgi:hypothetical protein